MQVSLVAVLVAALVNMVVGALWYSPMLFADAWVKESGRKLSEMKSDAATKGYALTTVASLLEAYILAHFVNYALSTNGTTGAMAGVQTGIWVWLGFVATTFASEYVFAGKSLKLWGINAGYHLVSLALMGGVLATWR